MLEVANKQAVDQTASLINEATVLLKSLRSLRAMRFKQINFEAASISGPMALGWRSDPWIEDGQ